MNKKRGVGQRFNVILDELDVRLIQLVIRDKSISIMDLTSRLGIKHKNLKQHLNRLESYGLIKVKKVKTDKKKANRKLILINPFIIGFILRLIPRVRYNKNSKYELIDGEEREGMSSIGKSWGEI